MFKPNSLDSLTKGAVSSNPSQSAGQASDFDQNNISIDLDLDFNNKILVHGATMDIYNRDEIFDRDRLISLASVEFDKIEFDSLIDLFNAKIFEHKLDRTIIAEIYSRTDSSNIAQPLENLDQEISKARSRLAAARTLYDIIRNTELSFVDPERIKSIQAIFSDLTKNRLENPLVKISSPDLEYDLIDTIFELTRIPKEYIPNLSPTYLYMQLLDDIKQWFVEGGHAQLMLHPFFNRGGDFAGSSGHGKLSKLWKLYSMEDGRKPLYQIGMQKNNVQTDYVFNNSIPKLPQRKLNPVIQRVAQSCSQLANEYRVSAGLGKVRGKKTGLKRAVSAAKKFPLHNMLGGQGVDHVSQDSTINGSLQDFAVVNKQGMVSGIVGTVGNNVALFDGYVETSTSLGYGYTDVRTAFIDEVKENPTNNSMDNFDKIVTQANEAFSECENLLNDVTCANEDLNILTPQGLFIRVLEEFCKLINYQGYEGDEVARAQQLAGIHLLGLCRPVGSNNKNSWHGVLKYRLNTYIQRLLMRRRDAKGVTPDRQVRISSREFSKGFAADLEEVNFDRRLVAETITAWSQKTSASGWFNAGIDEKSGIIIEPHKFKNEFLEKTNDPLITWTFNNAAVISGEDFLDINRDIDGSEGFLRGIADIFEEMENEAMQLAGEESYVTQTRLTNLSGFDASLTTMMILDCFCLLAESFCKTEFMLGIKTSSSTKNLFDAMKGGFEGFHGTMMDHASTVVATSEEEGDGLHDITLGQFSDYVEALRNIRTTDNAHTHVFGASASDEFVDAFSSTSTGIGLSQYHQAGRFIQNNAALFDTDTHDAKSAYATAYEGNLERLLYMSGFGNTGGKSNAGQLDNVIKQHDSPETFIKHVATKLRNRGASQFSVGNHVLMYESNQGDGRQTLLEILAAAKDGELNQLFDDPNQKSTTFIANEGRVPFNTSMARHDSTLTPNLVLETINLLAVSHVAPQRMFDVCKAMVIHLDQSTAELSRATAALRAANATNIIHRGTKIQDPNDQMQALVSLAKSKAGRRLIKGYSKRQLEIVESRMQALEAANAEQGYVVEFLDASVERALRMYLEDLGGKGTRGKFVFYGMPAGKMERLIYNKNAAKIDEEGYNSSTFSSFLDESFEDAELDLSVQTIDELQPSIKYKVADFRFPLNISIDAAGIAAAFAGEEQPRSMEELVRFCEFTLDSPFTNEVTKSTGFNLLPKYGKVGLRNVLQSFLIKKMCEITFSMDVSEKEMVATSPFSSEADSDRTSSAAQLMKDLSKQFLVDPKLVSRLFAGEKKLSLPNEDSIRKYAELYRALAELGAADVSGGKIDAARDLLISLYNTKPFFANAIEDYISRPSEFDYIFAVFVDRKSAPIDVPKTTSTQEGTTALLVRNLFGDKQFILKTIHTAATIRNRQTGEIL